MGDAFLVEFQSALDAVLCAAAIQQMMHDRRVARGEQFALRIGIHVGDVVESGTDILGDAVNIASRIYPLAEAGGVCISEEVQRQVGNKLDLPLVSLGPKSLKNVGRPDEVYKVVMPWEQQSTMKEEVALPRDRIAILPFSSFSPDPNDAYFADGVTDEIISAVAGISGLSVISRTSVMGYKGTTKKVEEIGRELKVGSVLEGSFKKAGTKIRVTTQLIDVASDKHLWAQNYDRNLDDIFEVQSDVAKQVADALRVRILSSERERLEKKPTESTEAYSLYLKGRYYWNRRGIVDVQKAAEYFDLAVHEDPTFALGYVGLADCASVLRQNWNVEPEANLEKMRTMVDKALELDIGLAEARATKGGLLHNEYRNRDAEQELRLAIQLKPSYARAHQWYYHVLLSQLRFDDAHDQIKKAVELDPMSPLINVNHGDFHFLRKEFDKAIGPYTKAIELGYSGAHGSLGDVYGMMKRFDDMKHEYDLYVKLNKDSIPLARLYAEGGAARYQDNKQAFRSYLLQLEHHLNEVAGPSATGIGLDYFFLGENDKGFEWLEKSYSMKEPGLMFIAVDRDLDGVRTDPRYLDLLKRLGLG
jgi:TolB-like protein/tetratricopeptide (TPR) repeat protein